MANTKNLTREERKKSRRAARKASSLLFARLSRAQKRKFRKSENKSLKTFVAQEQALAEAAQAKAAPAE